MLVTKKNNLYKCQLQTKASEDKGRYITYKNKLTSILRKAEKQYYSNKLNECKKDMKGTWAILNNLIGRRRQQATHCEFILDKGSKIYNGKQIANAFNDFYINVGPSLADKIDSSNIRVKYNDFFKRY